MIIYLLILVLFVTFYNDKKIKYISIFTLSLFLIAILRNDSVGTDYKAYISEMKDAYYAFENFSFDNVIRLFFNSTSSTVTRTLEPLWLFINYLTYKFGGNFYVLNAIIIASTLLIYVYVINRNSKYPKLSFLLYFCLFYYFMSFNTIRQGLALAFVLLFYSKFVEKKWILSILFILIAILFHYSALYSLLIMPLIYLNLNLRLSYFLLIISLPFGFILSDFIINTVLRNQFYTEYLTLKKPLIDIYLSIFINLLQLLLFWFVTKNGNDTFKTCKFSKLWLFALIMQNIFINYNLIYRIVDYFLVAQIIAIPNYFSYRLNLQNIKTKDFYTLLLILVIFSIYLLFNRQGILPYSFKFL